MKQLLTGDDHNMIQRELWERCRHLPLLSRREKLLFRNKLYLEWLEAFQAAQAKAEE